jgi:hypothetical protein
MSASTGSGERQEPHNVTGSTESRPKMVQKRKSQKWQRWETHEKTQSRKYVLDNQVRGQCVRRTEKENGKEKGRKGEEQKRKVDPRQSSGARMRG